MWYQDVVPEVQTFIQVERIWLSVTCRLTHLAKLTLTYKEITSGNSHLVLSYAKALSRSLMLVSLTTTYVI